MEGDQRWQQYVRERLEPRNAQENVYAWKCGRPTVHEPGACAGGGMGGSQHRDPALLSLPSSTQSRPAVPHLF